MAKETKDVEVKKKSTSVAPTMVPVTDWMADWPNQFGQLRQNINRLFDEMGWSAVSQRLV